MKHLFPVKKKPFYRAQRRGGRPRVDDRRAFGAILWYIRTGGPWSKLPSRFGSADTALRRGEQWWADQLIIKAFREYLWSVSQEERKAWKAFFGEPPYKRIDPPWLFDFEYVYRLEFL